MQKKKILFLAHANSINRIRVVNYFARNGWETHWITYTDPVDRVDPDVKLYTAKQMKVATYNLLQRVRYYSKFIQDKVRSIKGPLVMNAHEIYTWGLYGSAVKKKDPNVTLVLTTVGFNHIRTAKGMRKKLEKKAFERADLVVMYFQEMADLIADTYSVGRDNFLVYYTKGIDLDVFRKGYEKEVADLKSELKIPEGAKVVLSPRNMYRTYGIEHIVTSIPDVLKKHPDTHYVFLKGYGDMDFLKEMKKECKKLGVSENVRFVEDLVPYEKMPALYNMADITVMLPDTDNSSYSLKEAISCGSVIIATDISCNQEWVTPGENGFLVDAKGTGLSKIINKVLSSEEMRNDFYLKNKKIVEDRGDWNKNMKILEDAILEKYKKNAGKS